MNELEMIDYVMRMNMAGFSGKTRSALINTLMSCKARINKDAVEVGSLRASMVLMEANVNDLTEKEKRFVIDCTEKDAIIEALKKEVETLKAICEKGKEYTEVEVKHVMAEDNPGDKVEIKGTVAEVEVKEYDLTAEKVEADAQTSS